MRWRYHHNWHIWRPLALMTCPPKYYWRCNRCGNETVASAPTGIMLIYWFIENEIIPDKIYIHTANPVGRSSMQWAIRDMQKKYDREWPEAFR